MKARERCQTFLWGALPSCLPLERASQNLEACWAYRPSLSRAKYRGDLDSGRLSNFGRKRIEVLIARTPVHHLCCSCEAVERPRVAVVR